MAVVIRLSRHGRTHRPFYRVVAADKRYSRDGRNLEILGTYDPSHAQNQITLKADRVQYWLSQGAQPSETVSRLIKKNKISLGA